MRNSLTISLVCAGLLAGCGGSAATVLTASSTPSSSGAGTDTTVTVTRTVTTNPPSTPGAATTVATSATAASDAAANPAACRSRDLGIHRGRTLGAAGTLYVEFDFVNVSSRSCTLKGYPGVSLVLASGRVDNIRNYRNPAQTPHRVTVARGARTPFIVGIHGNAAHPCVAARHFRFIPPGQTAYEQIAFSAQVCGSSVVVEPVGYGNGG